MFDKLYIGINEKDLKIYYTIIPKYNNKINIDSLNLSIFFLLVDWDILENF